MKIDKERLSSFIDRYEEAMFHVTRRVNAATRDSLPAELTLEQYTVIRYIYKRGRCTSSELADVFCIGKSSVTAIINRLSDKRLIERLPDEKDRRVTFLKLTPEGERIAETLTERIQELLSRYLQHFSEEEARAFIGTFEKFARLLIETQQPGLEGEAEKS